MCNIGSNFASPYKFLFFKWFKLIRLNLNLSEQDESSDDLSSEDEAVSNDLDLHTLILSGPNADIEPPTADEVIREIDNMMEVL